MRALIGSLIWNILAISVLPVLKTYVATNKNYGQGLAIHAVVLPFMARDRCHCPFRVTLEVLGSFSIFLK